MFLKSITLRYYFSLGFAVFPFLVFLCCDFDVFFPLKLDGEKGIAPMRMGGRERLCKLKPFYLWQSHGESV